MTAQQSCERHPAAGPESKAGQGFVGIFGTGRQMPAMEPDQRGEGVAINLHECAAGFARCARDTVLANRSIFRMVLGHAGGRAGFHCPQVPPEKSGEPREFHRTRARLGGKIHQLQTGPDSSVTLSWQAAKMFRGDRHKICARQVRKAKSRRFRMTWTGTRRGDWQCCDD